MVPLFYYGTWGVAIFVGIFAFIGLVILKILWSIYRNTLVVTTHHIIDVDKTKLFRRKIHKFSLDDIEKIKYIQKKFLQRAFHYGNIIFSIQGIGSALVLKHVSEPADLKDTIVAVVDGEFGEDIEAKNVLGDEDGEEHELEELEEDDSFEEGSEKEDENDDDLEEEYEDADEQDGFDEEDDESEADSGEQDEFGDDDEEQTPTKEQMRKILQKIKQTVGEDAFEEMLDELEEEE